MSLRPIPSHVFDETRRLHVLRILSVTAIFQQLRDPRDCLNQRQDVATNTDMHNYTPGFWPRICQTGKTVANTGILPMALVAFEQYSPKAQSGIDDGLAADRPTAGPYNREWSTQRGYDPKYQLRRSECR
jgi:hypothetical protein